MTGLWFGYLLEPCGGSGCYRSYRPTACKPTLITSRSGCARDRYLDRMIESNYERPNRAGKWGGELSKKKRRAPEQIVRKLRKADALLATGTSPETIPKVYKQLGAGEATLHRWRD